MGTTEQAVRDGLAELTAAGILKDVDVPVRRTYVKGLQDVPALIVQQATARILQTPRRYAFTLPEWVEVCATIIDERRAAAARQAKALTEDCPDCLGSGWANAEGPNAVVKCNCRKRALELVQAAGEALARPALPPSNEEFA